MRNADTRLVFSIRSLLPKKQSWKDTCRTTGLSGELGSQEGMRMNREVITWGELRKGSSGAGCYQMSTVLGK